MKGGSELLLIQYLVDEVLRTVIDAADHSMMLNKVVREGKPESERQQLEEDIQDLELRRQREMQRLVRIREVAGSMRPRKQRVKRPRCLPVEE